MIDFEKAIKNISNGKDYSYSTDHFIVRITYKNKIIKVRFQVKGTDIAYKLEIYNGDPREEELVETMRLAVSHFMLKFEREMKKEILK